MAHYVLSDVHGESERFYKMLDLIQFSESDTLYIIGDVVDRGPDGVALLQEILSRPNMVMIMGNHEYMCIQYFAPNPEEKVIARWNRNGNTPTLNGFAKLSPEEKQALLAQLEHLPSHLELEVNGRRFYLVHGFPGNTLHDDVWGRPEIDTPNPLQDCQLIVGHTPVVCFGRDRAGEDAYLEELKERGEHLRILHAPGFIDIDCLCGYLADQPRALACLRLEDMEEFYV